MNTPLRHFREVPSKAAQLSDSDRLDLLEELAAPQYRIKLTARRGWWEMHTTSNQIDGRIGVRQAIDELAAARNYRPRGKVREGWAGRIAALLGAGG